MTVGVGDCDNELGWRRTGGCCQMFTIAYFIEFLDFSRKLEIQGKKFLVAWFGLFSNKSMMKNLTKQLHWTSLGIEKNQY